MAQSVADWILVGRFRYPARLSVSSRACLVFPAYLSACQPPFVLSHACASSCEIQLRVCTRLVSKKNPTGVAMGAQRLHARMVLQNTPSGRERHHLHPGRME